ncbi:MAG: hypothetical protein ABJL72_16545 [Roseobacter sp.]
MEKALTPLKDDDSAPSLDFLSDQERTILLRPDGSFRLSLYKVFLFQHAAAIKAGNLNLDRSYRYRPMDSYLIDPERWKDQHDQLLERAGLTELANPEPLLFSLKQALHHQYQQTNAETDGNPHLRFRADGRFILETPASEDEP